MKHRFIAIVLLAVFAHAALADVAEINSLGSMPLGAAANNPLIRDNYLFIPTFSAGLNVYDISTAGSPVLVASFTDGITTVEDIEIMDNYAFIADRNNGLRILDISSLADVDLTDGDGTNDFAVFSEITALGGGAAFDLGGSNINGLSITRERAYVTEWPSATANDLSILDISGLTEGDTTVDISLLAEWNGSRGNLPSTNSPTPRGVQIIGDTAYLCGGMGGSRVLDVTDDVITQTGFFSDLGRNQGVLDEYPELVDGPVGLSPWESSNPNYVWRTGDTFSQVIQGNIMIVGDGDGNMEVLDLSKMNADNEYDDTNTPLITGYYEGKNVRGVDAIGNYVFMTSHEGGSLSIVDINQIDADGFATLVGASGSYGNFFSVIVRDGIAYVTSNYAVDGLEMFDVSYFTQNAVIPTAGSVVESFENKIPVSATMGGAVAAVDNASLSAVHAEMGSAALLEGGEGEDASLLLRDGFVFKSSAMSISLNVLAQSEMIADGAMFSIYMDGVLMYSMDLMDFYGDGGFLAFENLGDGEYLYEYDFESGFFQIEFSDEDLMQFVGLHTDLEFRLEGEGFGVIVDDIYEYGLTGTQVPEPATILTMIAGVASLGVAAYRRFKA